MALPIKSDLDFESLARIINLLDPTTAQHPATKAYVDAAVEGINWKASCRVSTQGNVNVAAPGATIDGVTMVAGDRVLFQLQTAGAENGIYVWNGAATPATRAADMNIAKEVEQATCIVEEGTSAGTSYRQTQVNVTLGTTALIWVTFGVVAPAASTSTAGIIAIATQAEVNAGAVTNKAVVPSTLAAYTGLLKKFSSTFGDGSSTQFDVTHNFGSTDVQITVFRISDGVEILCDRTRFSTNVARLNFASAVATNALRCVVVG